jgi:hypothetical protein
LRGLRALLVAASCLWAGLGAAGDERRLARVLLSVKEQPRVEQREVVQAGVPWVLPLRVVDPGRLVVKAGGQVIAECALGWGEDNKLRVSPLAAPSTIHCQGGEQSARRSKSMPPPGARASRPDVQVVEALAVPGDPVGVRRAGG